MAFETKGRPARYHVHGSGFDMEIVRSERWHPGETENGYTLFATLGDAKAFVLNQLQYVIREYQGQAARVRALKAEDLPAVSGTEAGA